jgi:hypothetical protein
MREKIGWGLIIVGGVIQVAEGFAHADATLNNIQFSETAIGSLVAPVESKLPVSVGYSLIILGAGILWVLPYIQKVTK